MQAVLPDLNTAIIKFRSMITSHLKERDYTGCFGSLYAMNGILDPEFRVKVSTEEYNQLVKQDITVKCRHCGIDIDFVKIKVYDLILQTHSALLAGSKSEKCWVCTGCKKDNLLSTTEMKQTKLQPGGFLHVVPEPPTRDGGVTDRSDYHNKVSQWVWTFVKEIEERCGEERKAFLNREEMLDNISNEEE